MTALFLRLLCFVGLFAVASGSYAMVQAEPDVVQVSQFSGKQVPRFESLRYSAVHGRQGPTLDHPIVWRYERAGLPMLVVRETHGWRRVRDQDGDEVWVQARMLSSNPTAIVIKATVLLRKPEADAEARAKLTSGVIVDLERCDGGWCYVKVARQKGWVDRNMLWGVETSTDGL